MAQSAFSSINKLSEDNNSNTLANTPTWAVGVVCIIIVIASFFLELALKNLDQYFERTHQKPLQETLARMKEDVMMLGFISLMLVITRDSLAKICVPDFLADHMLPCQESGVAVSTGSGVAKCKQNEMALMSTESLHQLHMFIFVMAIVHVCYSCITMVLARLQIKGWRDWEDEIKNLGFIDSPEVHRQSHFLVDRVHGNPCISSDGLSWIDSFFRQFWNPVKKSDYLNLRRGFVKNHNTGPKFNFLNYMMKTMEDDFKTIVAIRAHLWMFVIIFMLVNIHGWYTYFWIAFIPFALLLIVGTKLQHVITSMAVEIVNSGGEIGGSVKPRDELFWFNNPQLMLHLIHFILFQNSFELAYFIWLWSTYGLDSCFMEKRGFVYARVSLGFISQILCSYTTLPLYALVTQMGSSYKEAIFSPPLAKSLREWHQRTKQSKKNRAQEDNGDCPEDSFETADIASIKDVGLLSQQDSSDRSHISEDSKAPVSEDKDSGLLAQKHISETSKAPVSEDKDSSFLAQKPVSETSEAPISEDKDSGLPAQKHISEASKAPVSKDKDSGLLAQRNSSGLSVITEESTCKDNPKAQEEHLRSSLNPTSGTGSNAEVQRRMLTSFDQSNADKSSDFVSVVGHSPVCTQESFIADQLKIPL